MIRFLTILLVLQGLVAANSSPRFSKIGDLRNDLNPIVQRNEILSTAGATNNTVDVTDRSLPGQESESTTSAAETTSTSRYPMTSTTETTDNTTSAEKTFSPNATTSVSATNRVDKTTDSTSRESLSTSTIANTSPKSIIKQSEKTGSTTSIDRSLKKEPTEPLRLNASTPPKEGGHNWVPWVAAVVIIVVGGVIAVLLCFFIRRERKKRHDKGKKAAGSQTGGGSHVSPSASRISATSPGGRRSSAEDSGDSGDSRDYGQPSVKMGLWAQKTVVEKSFKPAPLKTAESPAALVKSTKSLQPVSPKQATTSLKGVKHAGDATSIASKTAIESMYTAHTAKIPESLSLNKSQVKACKIANRQPPHASPSVTVSSSHNHS